MEKQVGFFSGAAPLAGILAEPILDNIAGPLIKGVVKKITIKLHIVKICLKK